MQQPVAQGREDRTPDPVLEYAQAIESDDPHALNQVMQKYGYNDDLMVAFLALHKTFDSSRPFTNQLYHYRATGETEPARKVPLIIPDAQGISRLLHISYRVWRRIRSK